MKRKILMAVLFAMTVSVLGFAQSKDLENVLSLMDKTAAGFRTLETDFTWDQYQTVVEDHDIQSGTMYFRRSGKNVEMAANIDKVNGRPDDKKLLFADGIVQLYQPKIDQITKYNAGKNRSEFESFLVLGFGGRGHDLEKSFDVKYDGTETVNGVNTYKLELTPKAKKVRDMYQTIFLWIDQQRGVSVQQKFLSSNGDYRLAVYKNIKINEKLPDVFKLKTTGKTKVVTPNG